MNYAPEIAGVGRVTGEIGAYLAECGSKIEVITTPPHYPGWEVQSPFANRYSTEILAGVTLWRAPLLLRRKMGGIWRLLAPLTFVLAAAPVVLWRALVVRPHIVLVIEPTLFCTPFAWIAARIVGAQLVLHVQDLEVDAAFAVGHLPGGAWLRAIAGLFERWSLRRYDRVVTISGGMAVRLAAKGVGNTRLSVVRNWVDLDRIRPLVGASPFRAELGLPDDSFVVLYSGNLGAKQGLGGLLQAAERLADDPRVHFIIAGEGPVKAELMRRFGHLPRLRFMPFQPYERFADFLGLADVHVVPQEAGAADLVLPSKLGGMLASGRPILATAMPGTELYSFLLGSAKLVTPGDPGALTEAIREAMQVAPMDQTAADRRAKLAKALSRTDGLNRMAAVIFNKGRDKQREVHEVPEPLEIVRQS